MTSLGLQVRKLHAVKIGYRVDDGLNGKLGFGGDGRLITKRLLGQFQRDPTAVKHRQALGLGDCAFQFTGVRLNLGCDVTDHITGHLHATERGLFLHDRHARFIAGHVDACNQSPVEARDQSFLELGDLVGGRVTGKNNLLVRLVKRVERMKELFLCTFAVSQEVNVIDDEHVDMAIAMAEIVHLPALHAIEELVDEGVAAQVADRCIGLVTQQGVTDRLEQVGFAQAHASVNEKRVVGSAGLVSHRARRRRGKAIARAGDKMLKRVIGAEHHAVFATERGRLVASVAIAGRIPAN